MPSPSPILISLLRINRHRMRGLRKILTLHDYSGAMHLILSHVCHNPGISQEQVACFFALDKTVVARDARRLEDLGHICRSTVPEDRRRYALHPTVEGEAAYAEICRYYDMLSETMCEGLSPAERAELSSLLERMAQNLEK